METDAAPAPVRYVLDGPGGATVWALNVGLACCAVESVAALSRYGDPALVPSEPPANLLVVSGTVTDAMAPAVRRLYDSLPEPRYVISFGACANTGGPYWDSYCVTKGVDQIVPVDVYLPGCPPRPEALLAGIRRLQDRLAWQP